MPSPLEDISQRIEVIKCYQVFLDNSVFDDETVASLFVTEQIQQFVKSQLEVLLGLKAVTQSGPATGQFTPNEVVALKAVAATVLTPTPKGASVAKVEPVLPPPVLEIVPAAKPAVPVPVVAPTPVQPKKALRALKKKPEVSLNQPKEPPKAVETPSKPKKTAPLIVLDDDGNPKEIQVELSDKTQVQPKPGTFVPPPRSKAEAEAISRQSMMNGLAYNQQVLAQKAALQGSPDFARTVVGEAAYHAAQRQTEE